MVKTVLNGLGALFFVEIFMYQMWYKMQTIFYQPIIKDLALGIKNPHLVEFDQNVESALIFSLTIQFRS